MSDEVKVALEALSSDVSRERLLEIIASNFECALLAAANPILSAQDLENLVLNVDDELWSLHPDRRGDYSEEHATIWMLYGIACNPNLSNDLKKKFLHHQNPVALIRFFDQMTKIEQDKLPIFWDPVLRYFLGQDRAYEALVIEAQDRSTESSRLVEIFDLDLCELVDRSTIQGDFEWYEGTSDRQIFTEFLVFDFFSGVFKSGHVDVDIAEALETKPLLMKVAKYFSANENIPKFSYLGSVALSNPNYPVTPIDSLVCNSDMVCYWNDYLLHEYHPSLYCLLDEMFIGTSYEIDTQWWLSISMAINAMDSDEELDEVVEVFDSMSLIGEEDIDIDDQFDDYVAMLMPSLVGSSEEFLERSFELDSHPIRQAILYNPRSTITIRDQANAMNADETREDELFVPSQIDMAKYAAFLGRYELIENWITTPEEFQELKRICPSHVAEGMKVFRG